MTDEPTPYAQERAQRLLRTAQLIGPFAAAYRVLADQVRAQLLGLPRETLEEIKQLGYQVYHGDPQDSPFEVREVGRVVEVQASIILAERMSERRS